MKFKNPLEDFKAIDYIIWFLSLAIILVASLLATQKDAFSIIISLIGASSLIFVAKGQPLGQFIGVLFAILYGIKSLFLHYYGEFATYVFMTLPVAIVTAVNWLKNPFDKNKSEIKIENINFKKLIITALSTIAVTVIFYFVLRALSTPNLIVSTISVATSFSACLLMLLRSPYYAVCYALNDIVLIVLWSMACVQDISNLPLVICFAVFLLNDLYGFISWILIRKKQLKTSRQNSQNK